MYACTSDIHPDVNGYISDVKTCNIYLIMIRVKLGLE